MNLIFINVGTISVTSILISFIHRNESGVRTDSVDVIEIPCNNKVVALILIQFSISKYYLAIRSIVRGS